MRVAVAAETVDGERRVAAVPETVRRLTSAGYEVAVERGAGVGAFVPDEAYAAAGATVVDDSTRSCAAPTSCSRSSRRPSARSPRCPKAPQ